MGKELDVKYIAFEILAEKESQFPKALYIVGLYNQVGCSDVI